ncbi:hypothetical protein DFH09DRAFT_1370909 [Mycena vulgaris]|nr:hypothetical protein DFH09DRAFT_1370909 [Mycena vulgaris]
MPAAGGNDGASASFSWAAEAMLSGDCACAAFIARADGRVGQISCDLRSFASRCGLSMRRVGAGVGAEPERETTGQCFVVLRMAIGDPPSPLLPFSLIATVHAARRHRVLAACLGKECGRIKEARLPSSPHPRPTPHLRPFGIAARQLGRRLGAGKRPFWEADDCARGEAGAGGAGVYAACAAVVGDSVSIGVVVDIGAFVFALRMLVQVSVSEYLVVLRRGVDEWRLRARVLLLDAPARTDTYSAVLRVELEDFKLELEPNDIEE